MERNKITKPCFALAMKIFELRFIEAFNKHGFDTHVSFHETLGDLTEEYHEFVEAVKGKSERDKIYELADVAIAAIWGIASAYQNIEDQE